ncbi:hypothetical protein ACG02S_26105 [Roseateles sp. DC23W]|uniref:Gene transfer agent family protein n=1 Tax=Pelomonas dachongensis TaxID=3299029 RepID=A0ABW7EVI0_9BURK
MKIMESQLLGVQIDDTGREVVLSLRDTEGAKFDVELRGVERLLVNELRQQNVVEAMTHWRRGKPLDGLRDAAFALMTGAAEQDCSPQLAAVACAVVDRVVSGELELMEISAVFGAQLLASFTSMTFVAKG